MTNCPSKATFCPNISIQPEQNEEEKEWPSTTEEVQFNAATEIFQDEQRKIEQHDDEFLGAEKPDFDAISFEDLYEALEAEAALEIDIESITVEDFRNVGWIEYLRLFLCGGCAIALRSDELRNERDSVFKIAALGLDHSNTTHCRMLQTLWIKLTDSRQCGKTGAHWQQIGFQGNDPSTDIRGSGLLGVLQLIFAIERYAEMMTKIYLLSISEHQHFPLAAVSFTVTAIAIRLLRSCLIYNDINRRKSVLDAINEIYAALFYQFYIDWKANSRTVLQFDGAQRDLEREAFSNWRRLLRQFAARGNAHSAAQDQKRLISAESEEEELDFGVSRNANPHGQPATERQNRYKA